MIKNVLAFSGGKDSTAMAVRLAELGEDFELLFTPADDEPAELFEHVDRIVALTGKVLVRPPNQSLKFWINEFNALPNWRQRWCTRLIKIEPCIKYLEANPGSTLMVGLRADEPPDVRAGLYGPYATYRYPLRDWGWGLNEVLGYLRERGIKVPKETNCRRCYGRRISQWWDLWKNDPAAYADSEADEAKTGYTFRSPGRDTWPAPLKELRGEFERGRKVRGMKLTVIDADDGEQPEPCRVCRF